MERSTLLNTGSVNMKYRFSAQDGLVRLPIHHLVCHPLAG